MKTRKTIFSLMYCIFYDIAEDRFKNKKILPSLYLNTRDTYL